MDKFKKTSESVLKLFEDATSHIECEHKKMFGYPSLFHNGNMFCGTFADKIFVRLDTKSQAEWMQRSEAIRDFEPIPGRKMKEYLEIPGEDQYKVTIQEMIRESFEYVKTLKPKIK
jgi:TfoX/Sxy family transcriptional regulator of competence genes